jgi:hypothetical protein
MEKYLHHETGVPYRPPVQGYAPADRVELPALRTPLESPRGTNRKRRNRGPMLRCRWGFPVRWLLLLGDVFLISLAIVAP